MNVQVGDIVENPDGSCTVDIECDAEFTKAAIQHYFLFLVTAAIDPNNKEYAIAEDKGV